MRNQQRPHSLLETPEWVETYLRQVVLAWETWALLSLHQSSSRFAISILRAVDTDVATALLHDDAEDYALLNADVLRSIVDSIKDAANIFAAVAGLQHCGLVDVEEGVEVLPRRLGRESRSWAREKLESHAQDVDESIIFECSCSR